MLLAIKAPSPRTPTTSVASRSGLKSDGLVLTHLVGPTTTEEARVEGGEDPKGAAVARDVAATPRTEDEVAMLPVVEGEA